MIGRVTKPCERAIMKPAAARAKSPVQVENRPTLVPLEAEAEDWDYALEAVPSRPCGRVEVALTRIEQEAPVIEPE